METTTENFQKVTGDVTEGLENPQVLNKAIMDQILVASDGEVKSASAAGTNMIRRRIREEGFTRRIIPPQTVTNDDLDRVLPGPAKGIPTIECSDPLARRYRPWWLNFNRGNPRTSHRGLTGRNNDLNLLDRASGSFRNLAKRYQQEIAALPAPET
jgi:hypothetical protein